MELRHIYIRLAYRSHKRLSSNSHQDHLRSFHSAAITAMDRRKLDLSPLPQMNMDKLSKATGAPSHSFPTRRTISEDCTGLSDTSRPHKYHCLRKEAQRHGNPHLEHLMRSAPPPQPSRSQDIPAHNVQQADQDMAALDQKVSSLPPRTSRTRSGRTRRGPFKDERKRRKKISLTRFKGACSRCRELRIRCEPDIKNLGGECLSCQHHFKTLGTRKPPCRRD
ncbi:hypothetical protein BJY01DRAFT_52665 [Aspergillus pseudoustus]|uniref:Zn(2)-C6 fungal-type domain-containing protein n=1 Tax=Aspergillus pseudoustus TaxID=1810923 RepID=A0ABR4JCJ3_9EURO